MFTSKYTWQVRERTEQLSEEIKKDYKLNHLEATLLENAALLHSAKLMKSCRLQNIIISTCHKLMMLQH